MYLENIFLYSQNIKTRLSIFKVRNKIKKGNLMFDESSCIYTHELLWNGGKSNDGFMIK